MKEKQFITQIALLKKVQPTKTVLNDMKQSICKELGVEHNRKTIFGFHEFLTIMSLVIKEYRLASYSIAFAVLLVMFLSVFSIILPNQFQTAMLYGRVTFASNQYQKAQIAFADTTSRFAENRPIGQNALALSQSIMFTNIQLNHLKLKGEKGKYSAQECHQMYQKYLAYLENEEKNIPANSQSFTLLRSQINSYEEQAEKKLHMYTSL